jgi:hypothetical protein
MTSCAKGESLAKDKGIAHLDRSPATTPWNLRFSFVDKETRIYIRGSESPCFLDNLHHVAGNGHILGEEVLIITFRALD